MAHDHHHHHHDHSHGDAPGGQDWAELGRFLEMDAEILSGCLDEAVSVLTQVSSGGIRRIADVGCGPGAAATALLKAFPEARVVALDRSPELLEMVRQRAQRLGVAARVTTEAADLEALNGTLRGMDLIWAGMVLHHLSALRRVLRELHGALSPSGLLAIMEFGPEASTLPDDLGFGAPGFTARHAHAVAAARDAHLPPGAMTLDWPELLGAAGFALIEKRTLLVDLPAPLSARARQWVVQGLLRSVKTVGETLTADDRATIAVLADPEDARGVLRRTDVKVQAGRSLFVARKA